MATVPNVQSNIQTIAQANSPFLANNGNPGTVYNMPNTGSYKPPMASALNQWALNPMESGAAATPFWQLPQQQPNAGGGNPFFVVPPLTTTTPPAIVQPPVVQPPVTPPVTTVTPPTSIVSGTAGSGGATGTGNRGELYNGLGGLPANFGNGAQGGGNRYNGGSGNTAFNLDNLDRLGTNIGVLNENGSTDWRQVFDIITEPWAQGNVWMSATDKWNPQNITELLANLALPGAGSLGMKLAEMGLLGEAAQGWAVAGNLAEVHNHITAQMPSIQESLRAAMENATNTSLANGGPTPITGQLATPNGAGSITTPWLGESAFGENMFAPTSPVTSSPFGAFTPNIPITSPYGGFDATRVDRQVDLVQGGTFASQGTGGSGAMEVLGSRMKNPTLDRLLTQAR